jgi:hypothetical protein
MATNSPFLWDTSLCAFGERQATLHDSSIASKTQVPDDDDTVKKSSCYMQQLRVGMGMV